MAGTSELAELAAFCTGPGRGSVCVVAGAGVGRQVRADVVVRAASRRQGCAVVSFFITARYKGQDDRAAFIDAVIEQLAGLLGKPVPGYLAEAARERHLLALLAEAAGTGQGWCWWSTGWMRTEG